MKEIWKNISGFEGLYQVSNLGRVRSLNYRRSGELKLLKQNTTKEGYKRVGLCKNNKQKYYSVHRLVALAFIPNPDNLPIINHKDENPSNNNVDNLEWCTQEYNINYGTRNERAGKNISESKKGKHHSKETKKKLSESRKGKHHDEKTKKKISEKMKGKYKGKDSSVSKPILMYDKEGNFIRRFDSTADANEYFGKDRNCRSIGACLAGRRKTMYGYVFVYAEEIEKN